MRSKQYFFPMAAILLALTAGRASASEQELNDHIGEISSIELLARYPEFAKEYKRYQPTSAQLNEFRALEGKEVLALFGTWCHDSEREIPRLLKLIDEAEVSLSQLTLYGVSRKKDDPAGYAEKHGLRYTPTLIVFNEGQELTRVIERPKVDLATDIAAGILANQ